jgi:4-hydroxy-tetrahydrodipicolinate reductase
VVAPLRVVQWATGNIGTRSLREVIRHPGLALVGLVVYDPAKAGTDAGTLCGEPATGVLATTDHQAAIALDADCVLYMPQAADLDEVAAMLSRGTNVVSTCGVFQAAGAGLSEAERQRVLDACEAGGSSIYATGSSPGFITEALPYTLLSLQRTTESVVIEEYADLSQRDSPVLLFDLMGYGRPAGPVDPIRADYLKGQFAPLLELLAQAAGKPVEEWIAGGELAAARSDVMIVAGSIAAGTVAAQRTTISGLAGGSEVVRFTATWYCSRDVDADWDLLATGWRVKVRGDAPMDVTIEFPVPVEELGAMTPALTANRPVNAVSYVVAAEPGFVTTAQLPPVLPYPL